MDEMQRKTEKPERFRGPGGAVTRIEFYGCFLVLVFLLAWRGGIANRAMEEHMATENSRAERMMEMLRGSHYELLYEVKGIPDRVERLANNLFIWQGMRVTGANHKAGTMRVVLEAKPKEYQEGMEAEVLFFDNGGERAVVTAVFDENKTLSAAAEIPFCARFSAEVRLKESSSEKLQGMEGLDVTQDMTVPVLKGTWKEFSHEIRDGKDILEGAMEVTAVFPDGWEMDGVPLQNCQLEIQRDGVAIQKIPMEAEWDGRRTARFYGRLREPVLLEEGRRYAFLFKAEDGDGAVYMYSIEEGALNAKTGRYDASMKWVDDDINGGNLVIE